MLELLVGSSKLISLVIAVSLLSYALPSLSQTRVINTGGKKKVATPSGSRTSNLPERIPSQIESRIDAEFGINGNSAAQWKYILDTLDEYKEATTDTPYNVFAKQMEGIARIAYEHRQENRGWAGLFIRLSFLYAVLDIADNPNIWNDRVTYISFGDSDEMDAYTVCSLVRLQGGKNSGVSQGLADFALSVCAPIALGTRHYKRHLTPVFRRYIKLLMVGTAKESPPARRVDALIHAWLNLRKEHQLFIDLAVIPTFDKNPAFSGDVWDAVRKATAKILVSYSVAGLREKTTDDVITDLVKSGLLTNEDLVRIHRGVNYIVPMN